MVATLSLLIWALMEAITVVGPVYPIDAVAGGTVVAVLRVSGGAVGEVAILQGDAPFVEPAKVALARWRFNRRDNNDVLVVINFRTPSLYSVGSATRNFDKKSASPSLPFPQQVSDPAYPPDSMAEGSVVLRLELSDSGSVSSVKTLQGLGSLTGSCTAAARSWQFVPAQNKTGLASQTIVYAVCVFRRPVLPPKISR